MLRSVFVFCGLLLCGICPKAYAFFDPPWITPADLVAGDTVFVNIHGGECDAIIDTAGYPQITREGNAVRILFFSVHEDQTDWCIYGEGTAAFPVDAFQEGNYTLQVDRTYTSIFGDVVETLGTIRFVVRGAQTAIEVPATTMPAIICLMIALAIAGVTRRRSSS